MSDSVRIVFLGGLGEIGRNCFCLDVDGRILVVDCGLMFPGAEEMPGVDPLAVRRCLDANNPPEQQMFQSMLFSKIVPNCKKLGLLDAADGWLRQQFTELGVIQFEDWVDTGEEYAMLDEVAKDRAGSAA